VRASVLTVARGGENLAPMKRSVRNLVGAGFAAGIMFAAVSALAQSVPSSVRRVPEINGNGAVTGAAVVLGGAAVILSLRKRRGT